MRVYYSVLYKSIFVIILNVIFIKRVINMYLHFY